VENSRFFHFSDEEKEKNGCYFPENRDFDQELNRRFSGNMSENQKFCVRARSAKNAGKPYQV